MTSAPRPDADAAVPAADLLAAAHFDHRIGPCRVFDQRFELRTNDAGVAGLLSELYAAMLEGEGEGDRGHLDVQGDLHLDVGADPTVYRLLAPSDGNAGVVARDDEVLVTSPRPAWSPRQAALGIETVTPP